MYAISSSVPRMVLVRSSWQTGQTVLHWPPENSDAQRGQNWARGTGMSSSASGSHGEPRINISKPKDKASGSTPDTSPILIATVAICARGRFARSTSRRSRIAVAIESSCRKASQCRRLPVKPSMCPLRTSSSDRHHSHPSQKGQNIEGIVRQWPLAMPP